MIDNAERFQEVVNRVEDELSWELINEFQPLVTMLAEALAAADAQTLVGYVGIFYFMGDAPPDIDGFFRDPIVPTGAWLMWQVPEKNTVSLWLPQGWRG